MPISKYSYFHRSLRIIKILYNPSSVANARSSIFIFVPSYFNPLYAGEVSFEDAIKHFGDEIVMKDNACTIELGDPSITTIEAGQISGRPTFDFADDHEQGGYVSTEDGEHGGQSVMVKKELRGYKIYTTVSSRLLITFLLRTLQAQVVICIICAFLCHRGKIVLAVMYVKNS